MKLAIAALFGVVIGLAAGRLTNRPPRPAVSKAEFVLNSQEQVTDEFDVDEIEGIWYQKGTHSKFNGILSGGSRSSKHLSRVREGKVDGWEIDIDEHNKVRFITCWKDGAPCGITLSLASDESLEFVKVEDIAPVISDGAKEPAYFNGKMTGTWAELPEGHRQFVPLSRKDVIKPYIPMWQR